LEKSKFHIGNKFDLGSVVLDIRDFLGKEKTVYIMKVIGIAYDDVDNEFYYMTSGLMENKPQFETLWYRETQLRLLAWVKEVKNNGYAWRV